MVIAVASDIHGDNGALRRFLLLSRRHGASTLLIAGDLGLPSLDLPRDNDITLVRGNCDSAYDFSLALRPLPPLVFRREWNGRTIVMTHGDRYPSPYGLSMRKDDIFIFGHIHQSRLYRDREGIIILNPGSLALPRKGSATYALIEEERITIRQLFDDRIIDSLSLNPS